MVALAPKTEKLDLRLSLEAKQRIQAAAVAANRSLSDFVLESALARADAQLPDRRRFELNAEQWTAFQAALDAPPRDLPRVRRLFSEPGIFDSSEPD